MESDGEQTCNHFKVLVAISFSIPEHNPPFHLLKSSKPLFQLMKVHSQKGKENTVMEIRCQIRIEHFILYKNCYFPQHVNASDQFPLSNTSNIHQEFHGKEKKDHLSPAITQCQNTFLSPIRRI